MGAMASQITSLTIVYSTVLFRRRSNKASKLRVTGLCEGNSPVIGEFRAQMTSNAENVPIRWRHHDYVFRSIYPQSLMRWRDLRDGEASVDVLARHLRKCRYHDVAGNGLHIVHANDNVVLPEYSGFGSWRVATLEL